MKNKKNEDFTMPIINRIHARPVFDSRGVPTVLAELTLKDGIKTSFITPSGASCGKKEALELRDNDTKRFNGKGVQKAIEHINGEIAQAIVGKNFLNQLELDQRLIELDGTSNKSRLGANAILPVSGAFFKALAEQKGVPLYKIFDQKSYRLPMPMVNVINGGAHANNDLDIQEFMIVPIGASSFTEALRMSAETFYALKALLNRHGLSTAVGDEGGFAPNLKGNEEAMDLLLEAMTNANLRPGQDMAIALDVAASELYIAQSQCYKLENQLIDKSQLLGIYDSLVRKYPICSIEDPFHEDDYEAFFAMVKTLGSHLQIVGDDLFVTNTRLIKEGIEHQYANAVLIKMNQIGTISETLEAINISQEASFNNIISHRSGETEDTTIADLSVLTNAGQIKTGSMSRSERMAKYNRLLGIEDELSKEALFTCPEIFSQMLYQKR